MMNLPAGNKKRRSAFIAVGALCLALLLGFMLKVKKGAGPAKAVDTEVEGVNLTFLSFNKSNEKKLEVKCRESKKKDDRWLHMKGIVATIFKADKLDEDIRVTADSGRTTEDFNDFDLRGHAVISSPSVTLTSDSFNLRNLNELSSEEPVTIELKDLSARTGKGLQYFISNKVMKLNEPKGTLRRLGIPYDFQARTLRVNERKKLIVLADEVSLEGNSSSLRGDRVFMQYDDGFVNLQTAAATGNGYFHSQATREDGALVNREITADQIRMFYDPQGRLELIKVQGSGVVSLASGAESGTTRSDAIEITLDPETQSLDKVRTTDRAEMASRGRNAITVAADSLKAAYGKDGSLEEVVADDHCRFTTDDFTGATSRLVYKPRDSIVEISGAESSITSGKNVFSSSRFLVMTGTKGLKTDSGVKAKLIPGKKSVLLEAKPVFVTASGLELSEKGDSTRFREKVSLFQDEVELRAHELLFGSRDNRISCRGGADLKFVNEDGPVELHGTALALDAEGRKIAIDGDARLQQGENALTAKKIELEFGPDDKLRDITASGSAAFSKKDLSGKARSLTWHYSQKAVLFKDSAEITRRNSGTTRGKELRFDLESNQITVMGAADRSETTIRQELP